jgi:hypothetical protein
VIIVRAQIQLSPDRRFPVAGLQFSGLLDFDDKRLCLLTHFSSKATNRSATLSRQVRLASRLGRRSRHIGEYLLRGYSGYIAPDEAIRLRFSCADRHCRFLSPNHRGSMCGLDGAGLTGDRLRLDLHPATALQTFIPCRLRRHSSRYKKVSSRRPPRCYGLARCGPVVTGLCDCHRDPMSNGGDLF